MDLEKAALQVSLQQRAVAWVAVAWAWGAWACLREGHPAPVVLEVVVPLRQRVVRRILVLVVNQEREGEVRA